MKGMRLPVGRRANEFVRWNLITVFVCGCACIYVSIIIVILPLCSGDQRFDIKVMNHSERREISVERVHFYTPRSRNLPALSLSVLFIKLRAPLSVISHFDRK